MHGSPQGSPNRPNVERNKIDGKKGKEKGKQQNSINKEERSSDAHKTAYTVKQKAFLYIAAMQVLFGKAINC